jgi:glycosyltransferase involved in cell wall biosynthesis
MRLRRRRRRLALVTPWPPEQSGVADYSWLLTPELAREVDVDVVVGDRDAGHRSPGAPGVSVIGADAFRRTRWRRRHDHVLYCMGNSLAHEHVYELLRVQGGSVLLHDAQLTGFFGWYAGRERPEDPLGRLVERVEQLCGDRVPREELRTAPLSWRRRVELGIFMTGEIQRHAERVFVHSSFAADVVRRDAEGLGRQIPVSVMPFGMPQAAAAAVPAEPVPAPLVVHMGAVSEIKGIGPLIDAFALLAATHSGARLAIGGAGAEAADLDRWQAFASERAPAGTVEILGRLDEGSYGSLLRRADLAVQLRMATNGEASGAVADCLASGVPTIVTDLGWMGELPRTAVEHVPLDASPELLAARMRALVEDGVRRAALSRGALEHAATRSFASVAASYLDALSLR